MRAFFDVLWLPAFLIIIYLFHPLLALVTVIGAAIMLLLALIEEWSEKQALAEPSNAKTRAQQFLRQTLANGESVVGLGMRDRAIRRWLRLYDDYLTAHERAADSTSRITGIAQFTRRLIPSIGLTMAVWLVINTPDISPGIRIAATILMGQALSPVSSVIGAWKSFVKARQAHHRLQTLIDEYQQLMAMRDSRLNLPRPAGMLAVDRAHLVFKDRLVLSNLNFQLEPGQSLGVIGLNAAGKTSLIRLLVGILPPSSGRVIPFLYRFKFSRADKINGYPVSEATTSCPITFNCSQIFSCKSAQVLKFTQLDSFFRCCQTRSMGLISGL